ncbi:MAG: iron complex outermembrane receptor protein [Arenicella sp.]|jgi:iron complex outermembrane receptor protein
MRKRTFSLTLLHSAAVVSVFCQTSMADESGPVTVSNDLAPEEVIVYGRQIGYYDKEAVSALKQSVPLLETPQSVFIINSQLIADQQSFRLDQILQNDSSVQKSNNFLGAYSSYQIRGFGLSNGSNYLRDGRTFFHLSAPPTELVERVEVLKGPASVLYGTMAPGGLINQVIKRPTRETQGSIKYTAGSYNFQHAHLDVGGSFDSDGKVRYRVNLVSEKSGSFREFFSGDDFETDRDIYAVALAWDVTDTTAITFNHDNTDDDRPQDAGLLGLGGELSSILSYDLIYNQPWSKYDSLVTNSLVEIEHKFSETLGVKLGYSEQHFERDRYDNRLVSFDERTGDNTILARRRLNKEDYTTYYADVTGEFFTGDVKHNFLLGVEQVDIEGNDKEIGFADYVFFSSNIFGPAYPDPKIAIGDVIVTSEGDRHGVYIQDMIELTAQWRILLGGRYDDYEAGQSEAGVLNDEVSLSNFTPRAGLLYLVDDKLSLYGSYSESFEPNSPVSSAFENAGEILDPTIGEMFEVGAKWELFDGNALITAAAFTIEREGSPFLDVINNSLLQRGLQRHQGAEVSASGLIGENLSLIGSMTYLDAELVKDDNPSVEGNVPAGVSDFSLSLSAEYQLPYETVRGLSVQGGIFYESDRPVDDQNSYDLDAYYRIDIGAKYVYQLESMGKELVTRLTVSNLLDEQYYKADNVFAINPERPREIRASIEFSF